MESACVAVGALIAAVDALAGGSRFWASVGTTLVVRIKVLSKISCCEHG